MYTSSSGSRVVVEAGHLVILTSGTKYRGVDGYGAPSYTESEQSPGGRASPLASHCGCGLNDGSEQAVNDVGFAWQTWYRCGQCARPGGCRADHGPVLRRCLACSAVSQGIRDRVMGNTREMQGLMVAAENSPSRRV